jgi:hypothetical protein
MGTSKIPSTDPKDYVGATGLTDDAQNDLYVVVHALVTLARASSKEDVAAGRYAAARLHLFSGEVNAAHARIKGVLIDRLRMENVSGAHAHAMLHALTQNYDRAEFGDMGCCAELKGLAALVGTYL